MYIFIMHIHCQLVTFVEERLHEADDVCVADRREDADLVDGVAHLTEDVTEGRRSVVVVVVGWLRSAVEAQKTRVVGFFCLTRRAVGRDADAPPFDATQTASCLARRRRLVSWDATRA